MRKSLIPTLILAALAPAPALAGGMGDPSTVLREHNAICELQRRGQAPRNPDMCLPELPATLENDRARQAPK